MIMIPVILKIKVMIKKDNNSTTNVCGDNNNSNEDC